MTLRNEKRKYIRFGAFLEGSFSLDGGIKGLAMYIDFSREGLRTRLNQNIATGKVLDLEIQFPGASAPAFAKGEIIWTNRQQDDWRYEHEAGIKLTEIDPYDRARLLDFAYEHWNRERKREKERQ